MKRILLLAFLLFVTHGVTRAQSSEPKLEGYLAPDGAFVSVEMAAGQPTTLIAKYLQMFSSAPTCSRKGQLYYDTTLNKSRVCTATPSTWETILSGSSAAAPIDATYITQTPNTTLTNEQALSALATGIPLITTTTGVISISNVTNDVQTKASIVPNTAPSAGQVLCGNAGGTAYAPCTVGTDATLSSAGALTLASTITAGGPTGSATVAPIITYDAKGRLTAVSSATITPAIGSVTGLGANIATALGVGVGSAGAPVINGGALGTPSSGTGTNITGIPAASILAGSFGAGAYVISTSLQAATIELGAATDTTLSRVSAGVIAVEGVNVLLNGGALGTPSSGTVTNLTGTASININGTVGATTPTTGAFTTISATGAITPSQTAGIVGTTTNNNANAGSVGEFFENNAAAGSLGLVTGTPKNITTLTNLPAGDYDITGIVYFTTASTTSLQELVCSISSTSATSDTTVGHYQDVSYPSTVIGAGTVTLIAPTVRFSLSGTTTIYLVSSQAFTVSTLSGGGYISARRIR